ncbi:MAG: asparagine synthase [Proteobacteria bacterium]|nr:asparagine synthase [Pseudomonadota bacterium]
MIGGYIFQREQPDILNHLDQALGDSFTRIPWAKMGFLFFDEPYADFQTACYTSEHLTLLSQDLLVTGNAEGDYTRLDLKHDFADLFLRKKIESLHEIVSDYRLVILEQEQTGSNLYLVSQRAGNGRMYYHSSDGGILFASDIRFLLRIMPLQVSQPAVYAMLKYGAIPEPLTISKQISAVPPAHYLQYVVNTGICHTKVYFQFEFPCDTLSEPVTDFDALLQPVKHTLRKSAQFLRQQNPAILLSGGIDSSLYASYLHEFDHGDQLHGINCTFGHSDPEFPFARAIGEKIQARLHVGKMEETDALAILNDTVALTGHPFSDFSSLPIVFILKFMQKHVPEARMLIEGNGADDCFGFPNLTTQPKFRIKHRFPRVGKEVIAFLFQHAKHWKWKSHEGILARFLALADNHEIDPLNYFLVSAPVNFLGLHTYREWDRKVCRVMAEVFSRCGKDPATLSDKAHLTIRQLLHINSRQWAAKAFSAGESLGIRVIYPYIWRDVLTVQGTIPWEAKVHNGIVKWPLKRLLEDFMPREFVYRQKSGFVPPFVQWLTNPYFNQTVRDMVFAAHSSVGQIVPIPIIRALLDDALLGQNLRFPVLNFLWAAIFSEMWIQKYRQP